MPGPGPDPALLARLRELARGQGLDPALAEAALDPVRLVAPELLELLRFTTEMLDGHASGNLAAKAPADAASRAAAARRAYSHKSAKQAPPEPDEEG
ncbi:MAG: hypothetical protein AB7D51_10930 [Desulfovibrionaceae bacterium]